MAARRDRPEFRTLLVLAMTLGLGLSGAASAQPVTGDWLGTLHVGAASLRLALHIRAAPGGGYAGTFDSLDQGHAGLPLADIAEHDAALAFTAPQVGATFAGKWDAGREAWVGFWTQGDHDLAVEFTRGEPAPAPRIEGIDGTWNGALEAQAGIRLRLVLHIETGPAGTTARLDSVDQGASGLVVTGLSREGEAVSFALAAAGARFEGRLDPAGDSLTGLWRQGGQQMAVTFAKAAAGAAPTRLVRPQTPHPPFPYRVEAVNFPSAEAGATGAIHLSGTLTVPQGPGPFPAVVLIAGSGPNTRDEPIFGHRPFLVLADHLTRHGFAVLRYDKRGVGRSGGDYAAATSLDFSMDADGAVAWLAAQSEIDPRQIGLIGHSEGGLIAPMVAARDPRVAFIVLMAGPAVNGGAILAEQGRLISRAMGMDPADVDAESQLREAMIGVVSTEKDSKIAAARIAAAIGAYAQARHLSPEAAKALAGQYEAINSPWFREFFTYDPGPTLRRLRIPVLALIGAKDLQVPADQNIPALKADLADDPKATVEALPGLNHLFQTAATGAVSEYAEIEETIAPSALALITGWIEKTVGMGAEADR